MTLPEIYLMFTIISLLFGLIIFIIYGSIRNNTKIKNIIYSIGMTNFTVCVVLLFVTCISIVYTFGGI